MITDTILFYNSLTVSGSTFYQFTIKRPSFYGSNGTVNVRIRFHNLIVANRTLKIGPTQNEILAV